jgi:hypothetical protein
MNTKGKSLLSGNIFCGHCGARLTLTTNGKKYQRKDGGVTVTPNIGIDFNISFEQFGVEV